MGAATVKDSPPLWHKVDRDRARTVPTATIQRSRRRRRLPNAVSQRLNQVGVRDKFKVPRTACGGTGSTYS